MHDRAKGGSAMMDAKDSGMVGKVGEGYWHAGDAVAARQKGRRGTRAVSGSAKRERSRRRRP